MADKYSNNEIYTMDEDWGNDISCNLPYSHGAVQRYIKSKIVETQTSLADKVLNCAISHLEIVKLAKFNYLPFVVIFEDDAYPLIKLNTELKKYLSVIPADAGIVLFGWSGFSIGKGE